VYESSLLVTLRYVAASPFVATLCITFATWSGRAFALPSNDLLASLTFISSVPVEISEYRVRTSTPPGLHAGSGTSRSANSPLL
jgi:hypothetical protein